MGAIRQYWEVYKSFLATCFAEAAQFRLNFILIILVDVVFYLTALGTVDIMYDHVARIGAWGRYDFLFFVAFMMTVDHLHMTFISEGFWGFGEDVKTGKLDFLLLKPLGIVFSVFFRYIRPSTLSIIWVPWGILIYYGIKVGLTPVAWVLLPLWVLAATALLVSIEILISLATFWVVDAMGVTMLRVQLQQVSRWPDFVYRYGARKFFTFVLPILLVGSLPVQFLLAPHRWELAIAMGAALTILIALIRWVLSRGLRRYESASS